MSSRPGCGEIYQLIMKAETVKAFEEFLTAMQLMAVGCQRELGTETTKEICDKAEALKEELSNEGAAW